MTEENGSGRGMPAGAENGAPKTIDWVAAERSPEFQELVTTRRRFVVPCTVFFLSWYFGFVVLAGYAPDFMGESIYEGLTVGYVLALSQFVMVWGLGWLVPAQGRQRVRPARRARRAGRDRGGPRTAGRAPERAPEPRA